MIGQAERELVKNAYPSDKWKTRVSKMSDSQVFAILQRLRKEGKA